MKKGKMALGILAALLLCGCAGESDTPSQQEMIPVETTTAATEQILPSVESPGLLPLLAEPENSDFVSVEAYLPEMTVELKYATPENFTGQVIYGFRSGYLRYGTVKKLEAVSKELALKGLYLKLWDGFRPVSAQFALWEAYPDPAYVADPNRGFGSHTRGNTVDITLVDADGKELEMPTGFDSFSTLADRDYSDCGEEAAKNAMLLQTVMENHGFSGYQGEWWHFTDTDSYDVETCFDPEAICRRRVVCEEFLTLRKAPDVTAEEILKLPRNAEVTFLGYREEFSLVDFWGQRGYVLSSYLQDIS